MSNKSIFFVTLPKSGTVFTWHAMEALTGLKQPNLNANPSEWQRYASGLEYQHSTIYASGDFFTQRLLPDRLRQFLPDGYIFGAHMLPAYHNVTALEAAGVKQIFVALRDPRDATVSWAHHVGQKGPTYSNYQSKIYPLPIGFFDQPYADQLTYHVRNFLPMAVTWIESWLNYFALPERRIDILFVYYDDLRSNAARYFQRIFEFFELGCVDADRIPAPEQGKRHYREGRNGAWEKEFSLSDKILSDHLIGARLQAAYARAATSCLCMIESQGLTLTAEKRLSLGLAALNQFPNSAEVAVFCAEHALQCGAPDDVTAKFRELQNAGRSTADVFLTLEAALAAIRAGNGFLAEARE